MVCPASQPQPPPAAANDNWLNRLRSSRGFPTVDDGLDLGSFLAAQAQTAHDLPKPRAVSDSRDDRKEETVVDMLRDLFGTGGGKGGCERVRGKSLRKQRNPSFWGGTEPAKKSSNGGCSSDDLRRGEMNVDGLASSEVTVIDSSAQEWKSEMLVFKKGQNEWKVQQKKGKLKSSMRARKRKLEKPNSNEKDGEDDDAEKRRRRC